MSNKGLWQKIGLQGKHNNHFEQLDSVNKVKPTQSKPQNSNRVSRQQSDLGIFGKNRKPSNDQQISIWITAKKQMQFDSFLLDNNKSQLISKPMWISICRNAQKQESIVKCESQQYDEQSQMKNRMNYFNIVQTQEQHKSIHYQIKSKYKDNISGIRLLVLILAEEHNNLKEFMTSIRTQMDKNKQEMGREFKEKVNGFIKHISEVNERYVQQRMAQLSKKCQETQQKYQRCQYNYNKLQQKSQQYQQQIKQLTITKHVQSLILQKQDKHRQQIGHRQLQTKKQLQTRRQLQTKVSQLKKSKMQLQQLHEQNYKMRFELNDKQIMIDRVEKHYQMRLMDIEAQVNQVTENYNHLIQKMIEEKHILQHQHSVMQIKLELVMDQVELLKKKITVKEASHKEECSALLKKVNDSKSYRRKTFQDIHQTSTPREKKYLTKHSKNYLLDDLQQSPNRSISYVNVPDETSLSDNIPATRQRQKWKKNLQSSYNKIKQIDTKYNFADYHNRSMLDIEGMLSHRRHKELNISGVIRRATRQNDSVFDKALQNLNELQRGVRMQINRSKLIGR